MKSTIKFLLLLLAVCLADTADCSAQCRIIYNYDAAGNRIKRTRDCSPEVVIAGDATESVRPPLLKSLSPNPTTGTMNGTFSEPVESAFIQVSDMTGNSVYTYSMVQMASTFTIDISAVVPGTYMLTVWASGLVDTYTVIKM